MFRQRLLAERLTDLIAASPVVVLTGARQTGKSTLLRHLFSPERIVDLDDLSVLRAFRDRPEVALEDVLATLDPGPVVLDETQRVPDLTIAVKRLVDRGGPFRFVLTGSANLTLLRGISESLAGRAGLIELAPLAFAEWLGQEPSVLGRLLERGERGLSGLRAPEPRRRAELDRARRQMLAHGSMPALLERAQAEQRRLWLKGYHQTYLERDVRDVGIAVEPLMFARTTEACAHRTGGILSWSDFGRDVGCSYHTAHRYVDVLRLGYQVWLLPAWSGSLAKRLVKSPKLYFCDVGVRNEVAGTVEPAGAVYETWLVGEIRKLVLGMARPPRLSYFRSSAGLEVDLVLEDDRGIIAIEAKARPRVQAIDASALRRLREDLGSHFRVGLVVYPGYAVEKLAPGIYAVPDTLLLL